MTPVYKRPQVKTNAGQLGLGSSRPGQISAWSHIKPGGKVFNKKESFVQWFLFDGSQRCVNT